MKSQSCSAQGGPGCAQKQIGEKRLEPKRPLVFITMDRFPHDILRDDRRTRGAEVQFHFPAVGAFERRGEIAGIGQAAAFAKRRLDEPDLGPAGRTDKAVPGRRAISPAKLAGFGIKKGQADVEVLPEGFGQGSHKGMAKGSLLRPSGRK